MSGPRLENLQWEHFAQLISSGMKVPDAYEAAGYKRDPKNAKKLAAKPEIQARITALLTPVMERYEITRERWMREVSALAFSDITKAMEWNTETTQDVDNDDGGEVLIIKHIYSHKARFTDSNKLDPMTRASIMSAKVSAEGDIEIKMHPKLGALRLAGEALRVIGRHQGQEEDPNRVPASERSPAETADELRSIFEGALKEHDQRSRDARLIEGTATEEPG